MFISSYSKPEKNIWIIYKREGNIISDFLHLLIFSVFFQDWREVGLVHTHKEQSGIWKETKSSEQGKGNIVSVYST